MNNLTTPTERRNNKMPTSENFLGGNLERARNRLGMSQGQFAEHLGLKSPQAYRNYEQGRMPRDHATLEQIANKLKIGVDDLLSRDMFGRIETVREGRGIYAWTEERGAEGLAGIATKTLQIFVRAATEAGDYAAAKTLLGELESRKEGAS